MIADLRHGGIVTATLATRRLRRLWPTPLLAQRTVVAVAFITVGLALGVGVWAGHVLRLIGVSAQTGAGVVILIGLVLGVGTGAIWGEVRPALIENRSWHVFADRGVSPPAYLLGRHVLGRFIRLVASSTGMLAALLVLDGAARSLDAWTWAAAALAGPGSASCGIVFALLRMPSARRSAALATTWALVAVAFAAVTVGWVGMWGSQAFGAVSGGQGVGVVVAAPAGPTAGLALCSLAAAVVVVVAFRQVRAIEWADIVGRADRVGGGRATALRTSRSFSGRRVAALALLDVRRGLRSFEWRVRPTLFTLFAMFLAIIALGALGGWLLAEPIRELTAQPVGATVVGGVCAGYGFVVFSSLAPWVSLDSDRRAVVLMRTLPGGIRSFAVTRAVSGSVVTAVAGAAFIGVLVGMTPLLPRAIGTAAIACAAVSVVAPTLACAVSMRYPQMEWKEASELGQRGWMRAAATYVVGIMIAIALSVASAVPWTQSSATLTVVVLVVGSPLVTAATTALLPTAIGVHHGPRR
ncbi:hypothetical protein [Microbacterium oleivorans]|uniref:Uncharacterized protein n=1 Tax=Microbacterium oleivorans TaxID=273677 RepID=A0A7D5JCT5_9MICO|nr:hypothetical protein [Microbacterium oleivorans]QLD11220.1 hypothetical protein HW566_05185 [Microbacterium oleivorans]